MMTGKRDEELTKQVEEAWKHPGEHDPEMDDDVRLSEETDGENPAISSGTLNSTDIHDVEHGREAVERVGEDWEQGRDRDK